MPDTHSWATPVLLPDGHRLFPLASNPFKQVAIADDSGREPQNTDDGILWIDFERPLMVNKDQGKEYFTIPLKDELFQDSRTTSDASTLLYLAATFNWPLVSSDLTPYKVEEH